MTHTQHSEQHSQSSHSNFALVICGVVAASIHLLLFAALKTMMDWHLPPPEKTTQTITLAPSTASIARKASQTSPAEQQETRTSSILSTTGDSEFSAASDNAETRGPGTQKEKQAERQTNLSKPANQAPAFALPQNVVSTHNSAQQQSIKSLFQNSQVETSEMTEQISTQELPELSPYEKALLNKLSAKSLYDEFHPILANNTRARVSYILSLRLFSTGAIRSAQVIRSSGIEAIDALAVQTAYRASPYPAPPESDAQKEFRYQIPIIYDRQHSSTH